MRSLLTMLFLWPFILLSQGTNNDIRDRSDLVLDAEPFVSNTDHNTVEWACLNKKLTEKCLVYHNDQWFKFHVDQPGKYFINIATKSCRDKFGVQLIVIEGNPCEINTYQIIECIRRIDQGETYVALNNLKAGVSYLVNVDGFMGDFCEFRIQLATVPWKPPVTPKSIEEAEAAARKYNKAIELSWELKDELTTTLSGFNVFREREGSHQQHLIREMGIGLNSVGANASKYTILDTLPGPGSYNFEIYGLIADSSKLVARYEVVWDGRTVGFSPPPPPKTFAVFPLATHAGTPVQVLLYNEETADRLWKRSLVYDPAKHATIQIELEPWLKQGLKRFLVVVIDESQRDPLELYFTTDRNGSVVQE